MTAQHVTVPVAGSHLDLFRLEDGTEVGSVVSTCDAIGVPRNYLSRFLESDAPEAAPYKDYTLHEVKVPGSKRPIKAVPLLLMLAFWKYYARKGSVKADTLLDSISHETLKRRLDGGLGTKQTDAVYEKQTAQLREWLIQRAVDAYMTIDTQRGNEAVYQAAKAAKEESLRQMTPEERKQVFATVNAARYANAPEATKALYRQTVGAHLN